MEIKYRDLVFGEAFKHGDQFEDTLTKRWVCIPETWVTNKGVYLKDSPLGKQHVRVRRAV